MIAKSKCLTYAQIAEKSGVKESTIKAFMCGTTDSRRVAENIADVLGVEIVYSNGTKSTVIRQKKKVNQ